MTTTRFESVNPATGKHVASYEETSDAALQSKVQLAQSAFVAWRKTSIANRARSLVRAAEVMHGQREALAQLVTLEMGKPITQARAEIEKSEWVLLYYADHAERMLEPESVELEQHTARVCFDPLGVIFAIMPWNFPFWQAMRCVAPTLMSGNTLLLKHAESTLGCGEAMVKIFTEAGVPAGVFQSVIMHRNRTAKLLQDSRVRGVSLTGSVGAGRAVGKLAGEFLKPCVLELGGSDACVVLADADLDHAVTQAVTGRMINSGQSCIAAKRFIIEAPLYENFVAKFAERLRAYVVGDPLDEATQVGPIARDDLRAGLIAQVRQSVKQGAKLVCGGEALAGPGYFMQPALLSNTGPGICAFDEETFGPVAAVCRANDADHAIALANQSVYGLGASIYTQTTRGEILAQQLQAGHVSVNGIVRSDPRLPFGGIKDSGVGRELGRYGLLSFVNIKTVWVA